MDGWVDGIGEWMDGWKQGYLRSLSTIGSLPEASLVHSFVRSRINEAESLGGEKERQKVPNICLPSF